jgi:hypothetical protein
MHGVSVQHTLFQFHDNEEDEALNEDSKHQRKKTERAKYKDGTVHQWDGASMG